MMMVRFHFKDSTSIQLKFYHPPKKVSDVYFLPLEAHNVINWISPPELVAFRMRLVFLTMSSTSWSITCICTSLSGQVGWHQTFELQGSINFEN